MSSIVKIHVDESIERRIVFLFSPLFSNIDGLNAFLSILSRMNVSFHLVALSPFIIPGMDLDFQSNIYLGIVRRKIRNGKLCDLLIINFDGIVARGDKGN